MRTILTIILKEFIQIFRNKIMLPVIFVIPIVQLIIIVNAATMEMKNINITIVDNDMSEVSRKLVSKFQGSPFFKINQENLSVEQAKDAMHKGETDVILNIPAHFEQSLYRENIAKIQVIVNAINGVVAGIGSSYIQNIIMTYNKSIVASTYSIGKNTSQMQIITIPHYWYNPELNYSSFMVPAILVVLVTMIGLFLSCLNLVREKEMGTIEQINVTPIKKYQFIAGKLIPFWVLGLIELAIGLIIGKLIYQIPIEGSLFLVFFVASIYLLVVLGLGLLISTMVDTQQQAMFIAFFVMMIFMMMSGIFTSAETMPNWAQQVNLMNPIYYFMKSIRMILMKGSGLMDILKEILSITVLAFLMIRMAVWRYRKIS